MILDNRLNNWIGIQSDGFQAAQLNTNHYLIEPKTQDKSQFIFGDCRAFLIMTTIAVLANTLRRYFIRKSRFSHMTIAVEAITVEAIAFDMKQ